MSSHVQIEKKAVLAVGDSEELEIIAFVTHEGKAIFSNGKIC